MPSFREKCSAIIAIIILVFCFLLIYMGVDSDIKAIIGLVVGFYFGQYVPVPPGGKNGQVGSTERPA